MNIRNGYCPKCPLIPRIFIHKDNVHFTCRCDYYGSLELNKYYNMLKDVQIEHTFQEEDQEILSIKTKIHSAFYFLKYDFEYGKNAEVLPRLNPIVVQKMYEKYEESLKRNTLILKILEIFINNYDGSEEMKNNIINNSHIITYKPSDVDVLQFIETFYEHFMIIIPWEERILNIKEMKSITDKLHTVKHILLFENNTIGFLGEDHYYIVVQKDNEIDHLIAPFLNKYITSVCQLYDGTIVASSEKDISIGNRIIQNAHKNKILQVISISGYRIASCSVDKTIKIWNCDIDSDKPISVLYGHSREVHCLLEMRERNILLSLDRIGELRIWSTRIYECLGDVWLTLFNKNYYSLCQLDKDRVVCGDLFGFVIVNIDRKKIEERIEHTKNAITTSIVKMNNSLICGTDTGLLYKYDIKTKKIKFFQTDFKSITTMIKKDEKSIIISYKWLVKEWYIND